MEQDLRGLEEVEQDLRGLEEVEHELKALEEVERPSGSWLNSVLDLVSATNAENCPFTPRHKPLHAGNVLVGD